MFWKGKNLVTIGDLMDAILGCTNKKEAQVFLTVYKSENQYAEANVGYLIGYIEPPERRKQVRELFGTLHPVFGKF